ncbi:DUF3152 domain-containing protein [Cumulibacter manganitolerans]|uniref:DUF3152 domain-containing protein n=1 Tax=Cumulibacter manganitolerans TaxID=1884992 RepID=UPI00129551B7|nr:DUF3152 domain-containing protein [Cumulibacter manganitolerans]
MAVDDPARGAPRRGRPRRLRRFARRHGWRAYAVPALTLLAVVALVIALAAPPDPGSSASAETTPSGTAPPTPDGAPATAEGEQAAPYAGDPAAPTSAYAQAGDGNLHVVPGQSGMLGTGGPVTTFDVEVEGGLGLDGVHFAQYVEQVLGDPRSWGAGGRLSFQRVDRDADLHVALVSPDHVEGLCPGYGTNGYTSCRYQDRAVINLARWSVGVGFYAGRLDEYREYVINHEVGHYLGHGHAECPAAARKAPVMMQQTLDVGACTTNSWPYPNGPADDPEAPA